MGLVQQKLENTIETSPQLIESLHSAREMALETGAAEVLPSHLVLAMLEDDESSFLLEAYGVEFDKVRNQLARLVVREQSAKTADRHAVFSHAIELIMEHTREQAIKNGLSEVDSNLTLAVILSEPASFLAKMLSPYDLDTSGVLQYLELREGKTVNIDPLPKLPQPKAAAKTPTKPKTPPIQVVKTGPSPQFTPPADQNQPTAGVKATPPAGQEQFTKPKSPFATTKLPPQPMRTPGSLPQQPPPPPVAKKVPPVANDSGPPLQDNPQITPSAPNLKKELEKHPEERQNSVVSTTDNAGSAVASPPPVAAAPETPPLTKPETVQPKTKLMSPGPGPEPGPVPAPATAPAPQPSPSPITADAETAPKPAIPPAPPPTQNPAAQTAPKTMAPPLATPAQSDANVDKLMSGLIAPQPNTAGPTGSPIQKARIHPQTKRRRAIPESLGANESLSATGSVLEKGRLVESIPRKMTVHKSTRAEVRITRAHMEEINSEFASLSSHHIHNLALTEAMTVQLRAPGGGFHIENLSPQTQWIDRNQRHIDDADFGVWRWNVIPTKRGKARLQLVISARTVDDDGTIHIADIPDKIIDLSISRDTGKVLKKAGFITLVTGVGALLGKFGETAYHWLSSLVPHLI